MRVAALVLGITGLFGCAGAVPIVRSAAVEDFQCPAERVGIARMGGGRYRALGCGQRAIYECAVADVYVCTMEAEIQAVQTSDQIDDRENGALIAALRGCDLGPVRVTIEFGSDGTASSLTFSDDATSRQRSCVAHVAADHVGSGLVRYPAAEVPAQDQSAEVEVQSPEPNVAE
ncbi:MAG: hypothetical protein ACI9KE_004938 [Polyangiales bacterium]|jgi:hypothetical protein